MDTQVLIVGAGPTGLMLANQLVRWGIKVCLIDRHEGPAQQTRAMGVQARTLEIYAKLGIAETAIARGAITRGVNIWASTRHKARIPVNDAGKGLSAFPFVLMLGQDDNEHILGERLRSEGVSVQWKTELIRMTQHADHVEATIRQPDGVNRTITAQWVAGCDGSRSSVREMRSIAFPGAPYEHVFFVADTVATGGMVPGELNAYLWRKGFHLFFPMRGQDCWRVIGILPVSMSERPDLTFDDLIPELQREVGGRLAFQQCRWFSTYRIQHRCAEHFKSGRCFLLGDAAHIHSPMGAQGMNTGLQDAYNLAWKLALVLRGEARESLLDTYEAERRPVAQALLRGTDRAFGLVVSDNVLATLFRTRIMGNMARLAMRFQRVQRLAFRVISQVGVRYRASPLSRAPSPVPDHAPQAGDRFPYLMLRMRAGGPPEDLTVRLDDRQFNLVVIGQGLPTNPHLGPMKRIEVPRHADNDKALALAGLSSPSFYLLRPDGHIALTGALLNMNAIDEYFQSIGMLTGQHAAVPVRPDHGVPIPSAAP